jgi:hypothetical protein
MATWLRFSDERKAVNMDYVTDVEFEMGQVDGRGGGRTAVIGATVHMSNGRKVTALVNDAEMLDRWLKR